MLSTTNLQQTIAIYDNLYTANNNRNWTCFIIQYINFYSGKNKAWICKINIYDFYYM